MIIIFITSMHIDIPCMMKSLFQQLIYGRSRWNFDLSLPQLLDRIFIFFTNFHR